MPAGLTSEEPSTPLVSGRLAPICASLDRAVDVLARVFAAGCLLAMVGVVLYEIIGRRFLVGGAAAWTNEVAVYLFIWATFIGIGVTIGNETEPRILALVSKLPAAVQPRVKAVVHGASIFVFVYILLGGIHVAQLEAPQRVPTGGFSLAWAVAAIPTGAGLALMRYALRLIPTRSWKLIEIATVVGLWLLSHRVTVDQSSFYPIAGAVLVAALVAGSPIATCFLLATILSYSLVQPTDVMVVICQHLFDNLDNFTLVAIPLFLLTGAIVAYSACAPRLSDMAQSFVGRIPGGIAVADVAASAVLADVSGSAVADTAALGTTMIPQMERAGYSRPMASAIQASAGTLGILFPPSISMLLYAAIANLSVAYMFAALLLPGVMVALTFMVVSVLVAHRRKIGHATPFSINAAVRNTVLAVPGLGTIAVVLGGIFTGLFTASEAGAVAATYCAAIGVAGYRQMGIRRMLTISINEALEGVARVGFIITAALTLGFVVVLYNGPQDLINSLGKFSSNATFVVIILLFVLIFVSAVLEASSTILLAVPLLLPLLQTVNYPLARFGVLLQLDAAISLILPPIGLCLLVVSTVGRVPIESMYRHVVPYICALAVDVGLVMAIPSITTTVPRWLGIAP